MDTFTRSVLAVIAVALCAIAVRLWMPGYATMGELQNIGRIEDDDAKQKALASWRARLPLVRIQGGTVDVDVTGIPPTVDVNVTGMSPTVDVNVTSMP